MQILQAYKCYVSARQTAVMQATCMLYVLQINQFKVLKILMHVFFFTHHKMFFLPTIKFL